MSLPVKSPSRPDHVRSAAECLPDDTLMIDVDFFDEQGRWNPKKQLFSARDDPRRSQSVWTKLFGSFMALHGKVWAKNFLKNHFGDKPEARQLLENIRKTGRITASEFRETAARCSFSYVDIESLSKNSGAIETERGVFDPFLKDIDLLTFNHISNIDWSGLDESYFPKITSTIAKNIAAFIDRLEVSPVNEPFIAELEKFSDRYLDWIPDPDSPANDAMLDSEENRTVSQNTKVDPVLVRSIDRIISKALWKYRKNQASSPPENSIPVVDGGSRVTKDFLTPIKEQLQLASRLSIEKQLVNEKISLLSQMERIGLIRYFELGDLAFDRTTSFLLIENFIGQRTEALRERLPFLTNDEFDAFEKNIAALNDRLPELRKKFKKHAAPDESLQQSSELYEGDRIAPSTELASVFDEEVERAKSRGVFAASGMSLLISSKLIEYLRKGIVAFDDASDFSQLERVIGLPTSSLRILLRFLADEQFDEFLRKIRVLKDQIPAIKAGAARRTAVASVRSGKGSFDQFETIDADMLLQFRIEDFDRFEKLSETDAKKIVKWIASLGSGEEARAHEGLIRELLALTGKIERWLRTMDSGKFNAQLRKRDVVIPIRNAANEFLKKTEPLNISAAIKSIHHSAALNVSDRLVFVQFSDVLLNYSFEGPSVITEKNIAKFNAALEPGFLRMIDKVDLSPFLKEALLDLLIRLRRDISRRGM